MNTGTVHCFGFLGTIRTVGDDVVEIDAALHTSLAEEATIFLEPLYLVVESVRRAKLAKIALSLTNMTLSQANMVQWVVNTPRKKPKM